MLERFAAALFAATLLAALFSALLPVTAVTGGWFDALGLYGTVACIGSAFALLGVCMVASYAYR